MTNIIMTNITRLRCRRRHVRERLRESGRLGHALRERQAFVSPEARGRTDHKQRGVRRVQLHGRFDHREHVVRRLRDRHEGLVSG